MTGAPHQATCVALHGRGLDDARRRSRRRLVLASHLHNRRRDGDGDEHDSAEAGQHLAVHRYAPSGDHLPLLNICALPG